LDGEKELFSTLPKFLIKTFNYVTEDLDSNIQHKWSGTNLVISSMERDLEEFNAISAVDCWSVIATEGSIRDSPSLERNLNHFNLFTNFNPIFNTRLVNLYFGLFTDCTRSYT
jgi:hypothetical protein